MRKRRPWPPPKRYIRGGTQARAARLTMQLTQRELADMLEISERQIKRFEASMHLRPWYAYALRYLAINAPKPGEAWYLPAARRWF